MSIKSLMATAFGAALMVSAMSVFAQGTTAEDEKKGRACCMSACGTHASGKMRCSLTGKTVETCCCVHNKEGKLHCNLADKDVEICCCKPAADESDASDETSGENNTAGETNTTGETDTTDDRDTTADEARQ